jgi:hypothetical protein
MLMPCIITPCTAGRIAGSPSSAPHHGGVQRVHDLAGGVGEGVGDRDQVAAGDAAHRGQFDVDGQLITLDDGAVLLEDLFGLQVHVVPDDDLLEHALVAGHRRGRREGERRDQPGVAQLGGGLPVPVRGVLVLHRAGELADLLPAHQIGVFHLVVVADPGFQYRRDRCCGHVGFNSSICIFATADHCTLTRMGARAGIRDQQTKLRRAAAMTSG